MKKLRKMLALLLAMTMVLALGATAFASEVPTEEPTEAPTTEAEPTTPSEEPTTPAAPAKGTITITNPVTDPNADITYYDAYKIFDMTTNGATGEDGSFTAVAYTIAEEWVNFFVGNDAPGAAYIVANNNKEGTLNPIVVNGVTKYINITEDNVAEFAKVAFEYSQKNKIAPTATEEVEKGATTVQFKGLDLGYYMVYPRGASVQSGDYTSIVSLTSTSPDGKVDQKAEWPELTKTADDISTEVGQKVNYTLESKVPDTTGYSKYVFTFEDMMSEGLTFDGVDSITVKIGDKTLEAPTDYTVTEKTDENGNKKGFSLTIDMLKTDENGAKVAKYDYNAAIKITYSATVNDKAVAKVDKNHATLTYHNDPKDDSKTETTPPEEVKTYSSKIEVVKGDARNKQVKLEGAKFVLRLKSLGTATGDSHEEDAKVGRYYYYDETDKEVKWVEVKVEDQTPAALAANTNITVVTTDENGFAHFDGLEDGVYELIEVEAPEGYNLVTTPVEVTIAGNPADVQTLTYSVEVENKSGSLLPTTGGIGTTIFTIVGLVLIIGAGVTLIVRRRMAR